MKDRRGEDYKNLEDNEALSRIVNKVKFSRGQIKERRVMGNPIKETWLFVGADGNLNDLGKSLLEAFTSVYKGDNDKPSFSEVFEVFYKSSQKKLPKLTKRVGMEKKRNPKTGKMTILVEGTGKEVLCNKEDWKRKAQTFLKNYITKGIKARGKKVEGRVAMLLRGGANSSQRQRQEAAAFLEGLGAFTDEDYTPNVGKTITREESIRLGAAESRQTTFI